MTPIGTLSRRAFLLSLPGFSGFLANAAERLPAGRNVKWAVSSGLWRHVPNIVFTDILEVMKETGFQGVRLVDFPGSLAHYGLTEAKLARVEALIAWGQEHSVTILQAAIGALAAQPGCSSVIAGSMNPEQVKANVAASEWIPSAAELAEIDQIVPAPASR